METPELSDSTAIPILNREFQLPADGWYQLAPIGEFPHQEAGVIQVVDREGVDRMVNAFRKDSKRKGFVGLLVDYDHFSLSNATPSKAAGWVTEMKAREDGLWGRVRWSKSGKDAVEGGDYRYISPVWNRGDCEDLGDGKVRPLRLRNAAVTNEPNLRGIAPLSNRAEVEKSAIGNTGVQPDGKDDQMKQQIVTILGLAADAADDVVLAKVQELANSAKEVEPLRNRVQTFEAAARDAQIEKDLDTHKDVFANRDEAKKALMANRDATLAAWALLKKPVADKPLPNRADGKTPDETTPVTPETRRAEQVAFVTEVMTNRKFTSRAQAYELAVMLKPELFK